MRHQKVVKSSFGGRNFLLITTSSKGREFNSHKGHLAHNMGYTRRYRLTRLGHRTLNPGITVQICVASRYILFLVGSLGFLYKKREGLKGWRSYPWTLNPGITVQICVASQYILFLVGKPWVLLQEKGGVKGVAKLPPTKKPSMIRKWNCFVDLQVQEL
jgi:hypothetical protein